MSSLSATQADGYYIPPAYLNSGQYKKKSVTQFNHPNHKGHNQYLSNNVVRFEFPYDGFCLNPSCRAHVGKGTRFNAQKKYLGTEYDYHTSKVYEFRMTCRSCGSKNTTRARTCTSTSNTESENKHGNDEDYTFVIRNNPKERRFDYVSGVKRKVEEFDTVDAKSLGVIDTDYGHAIHNFTDGELKANGGKSKLSSSSAKSAIDRLEREIMGERKTMTDRDAMEQLLQHNRTIMYDDAMSNSKMRASYRVQRKRKKRRLDDAKEMGLGRGIELDPREDDEKDRDKSSGDQFRKALESRKDIRDEKSRKREKSKFLSIRSTSIFGNSEIRKRRSRSSTSSSNNSRIHTTRNNKSVDNYGDRNYGSHLKVKKVLNISIQGQGQGATPVVTTKTETEMMTSATTSSLHVAARSPQQSHGNVHTDMHRGRYNESKLSSAAADCHNSSPLKLSDCDTKPTKEVNRNNSILQSLANYGSDSDSD